MKLFVVFAVIMTIMVVSAHSKKKKKDYSYKGTCAMGDNVYEKNEKWLDSDCSKIFKCRYGRAVPKKFKCPKGSECKKGKCRCINLSAVEDRDKYRILKRCKGNTKKRTNNRGAKSCRVCGHRYKNYQKWLNRDCSYVYQCNDGKIVPDHYKCPDNSICKRGKCVCKRGYKVDSSKYGVTSKCMKKRVVCKHKGRNHKDKSFWLNASCSKKYNCNSGTSKSFSYQCPANSDCKMGGRCVCYRGYRTVKNRNGLISKCIMPKRKKCGKGFKRMYEKCLAIKKYAKVDYFTAKRACRDMGGRLLVAKNFFGFFQKIYKDKTVKGRGCYIGGAPELAVQDLKKLKSKTTQKFVFSTLKKFKISGSLRFKTLKRFSGKPNYQEMNYQSPMSSFCPNYDFHKYKMPSFSRCFKKMGFICEEVSSKDSSMKWSKWFNMNTDLAKGDHESIYEVVKKLNNDPNNKIRLCRKPVAIECRDASTKKLCSKTAQNGWKLQTACVHNRIMCRNKDQADGKKCPDFEIRFKCPYDAADTCKSRQVAKACQLRGMKCVDRCNGAVCVRKRRVKNKKEMINTAKCTYNGKDHVLHLCRASGDPHYTTLDGYKYNFMGECSYNFMSTSNSYIGSEDFPAFSIVIKNYKKESKNKVTWTKSFELNLGSTTYTFTQGKFYITNGLTVESNAIGYSNDQLKITAESKGQSKKLLIETSFCLRIIWDNVHALIVYAPEVYMNKVTGLCGNYDGKSNNDLINPGTDTKMTTAEIGEYYIIKGPENEICNRAVPSPAPCSETDIETYKKPEYCGVFDINGNSPLVKAVFDGSDGSSRGANSQGLQNELLECVQDLCWDQKTDRCHDLEDTIEEIFSRLCLYDQYLDGAWRKYANCMSTEETRCAQRPNMVYSPRYVTACQNTCYEPDKADNCDEEDVSSGCICAEGFYLDSKLDCVPLQECDYTCTINTENGETVQIDDGAEYVAIPCQLIVYCNKGQIEEKPQKPCSEHAECIEYGRKCKCKEGYIGKGYHCESIKSCRKGYTPYRNKCYKYVAEHLDWNSAAINCGADGSQLARYDDEGDQELTNFMKNMPEIHAKTMAIRRNIFCGPGSLCQLPSDHIGIQIRLKDTADMSICKGNFKLADDGRSVVVNATCKATFVVTLIKEVYLHEDNGHFGVWIGGNSHVISQSKRIDEPPFQIDPPRIVDFGSYQNPFGCFQAVLSDEGALIVLPVLKCRFRKASVCEYDNTGSLPYDPLDFKGIKVKANYQEALELCEKLDRPLAIITNKQQLHRVHEILSHLGDSGWIGAQYNSDSGKFLWSDDSHLEYKKWKEGEPNNYNGEQCLSMDSVKGDWSSDNCNDLFNPICGLSYDIEPAVYTRYFDIKNIRSLNELRRKLANIGDHAYVCERPFTIECSAQNSESGDWVTNFDQTGETLFCTTDSFHCHENEGLNCASFRVRFYCPAEENQCKSLKDIGVAPCDGGRLCLPVRNHYVCRCPNGKRFNERTQTCSMPCGTCVAWGDPHYTTLYGDKYDFMGDCMYKYSGMCPLAEFATEPYFDVFTKNRLCGSHGTSCLDYIEVHLRNIRVWQNRLMLKKNFIFKVKRGTDRYVLNDKDICQTNLEVRGVFKLSRGYNYFSLYVDSLGLSVLFTGSKLIVTVSDMYHGKMCGLCGDCSTEQFELRNGTLVTVPTSGYKLDRNKIIPVVNEWIVQHKTNEDLAHCKIVGPLEECTPEIKAKLETPEMCGIYTDPSSSIGACFTKVDPHEFYSDCVVDACHTDAQESLCNSLKAYTQKCLAKGVIMNWRRDDFCKYECHQKEYRSDASCQRTCGRTAIIGNNCDEEPEEGCVCPGGLLRQADKCVQPHECGCDVVLNEDGDTWHLLPGESTLLPGCREKAFCETLIDGTSEDIRESFSMDPNAICKEGPPPYTECVEGYVMADDNVTCKKLPKECSRGYVNRADMCVKDCEGKKIWRQAIEVCNLKDGTLALIDTIDKLSELKNIMQKANYKQVFITGQVKVIVDEHNKVSYEPVIDYEWIVKMKVQYYNFHYHLPPTTKIVLTDTITIDDVKGNDVILALAAILNENGSISIVAVPRDNPSHFICEEREVPEEDKKWYGPCNSDTLMKDGDIETKDSLMVAGCLVCPVPMEIKCDKVPNAPGSVSGSCRITRSGTYYSCTQGTDCIDHQISTKCAADADECSDHIDDCPGQSTCINTIGAYRCKCNEDYPLMIRGQCQGISKCSMTGPKTSQDFVFSFNGFSNKPGYFDYDCQFLVGGICEDKYNKDSGFPYIEINSMSAITSNGLEPAISGYIYDPASNSERKFAMDPALFKEGKILYGENEQEMTKVDLGFVNDDTNTFFSPITGDVLIIRHLDGYYKATISFPMEVKLELADVYADMRCGVCSVAPETDHGYIMLSDEQAKSFSVNPEIPCERYVPPTPSTTTASTTTTTTTTTTTSTTTMASTTTEDSCDMAYVCRALSDLCTASKEECIDKVCGEGQDICQYLEANAFSNCAGADIMQQFLSELSCDRKVCKMNMRFAYSPILIQRSCLYPEGNYDNQENSNPDTVFTCICNEGFIFSGSECIPFDECGCIGKDGLYFERGESWNNDKCTETHYCEGGNRITPHPYKCHAQAECVPDVKGFICQCKQGYFGNGDGDFEDGCIAAEPNDDGSKLCYRVYVYGSEEKKCICNHGYTSDCFDCSDINECTAGLHHCDGNTQKCINLPGTYRCECAEGLKLEAGKCVRVFKKRLCEVNGPVEKVITFDEEEEGGLKCLAQEKIIKTCENLICDGGPQACCQAAGKEPVEVLLSCYHPDGTFGHYKPKMYYEATSCKCNDGDIWF